MEWPFLGISKWGGHRFHMEEGKNIYKTLVQVVIWHKHSAKSSKTSYSDLFTRTLPKSRKTA